MKGVTELVLVPMTLPRIRPEIGIGDNTKQAEAMLLTVIAQGQKVGKARKAMALAVAGALLQVAGLQLLLLGPPQPGV